MSKCKFCQTLDDHKEYVEKFAKKDESPEIGKYRIKFTAALVIHSWWTKVKNKNGRITDYMKNGRGYPLNYCPECGRKL